MKTTNLPLQCHSSLTSVVEGKLNASTPPGKQNTLEQEDIVRPKIAQQTHTTEEASP